MESRLGPYLLGLLPNVRRRVDNSVLSRLLDALGLSLDAAKDAIYRLRRRGFLWTLGDGSNAYYADPERTTDLERHAVDRGTRRLAGETNAQLEARLAIMPSTRQYAGSAMGMRYLVEDVLGHTLSALTVYADDPEARVLRTAVDQAAQVEAERSHILAVADQAGATGLRQNRLFSGADLDTRFTFWATVDLEDAWDDDEEQDRILELIQSEKPAHTAAVVNLVTPQPVHAWSRESVMADPFAWQAPMGVDDELGSAALTQATYVPTLGSLATGSPALYSGVNLNTILHGQRDAYLTFHVRLQTVDVGNAGILLQSAGYALLVSLVGPQMTLSIPWSTPRANSNLPSVLAAGVDYSVAIKLEGGKHRWWVRRADDGSIVTSGSDGTDTGLTINLPTASLAVSELIVLSAGSPARQVHISHVNVGRATLSEPDFTVHPNDVIACRAGVGFLQHRRAPLLGDLGFGPSPGTVVVGAAGVWGYQTPEQFNTSWRLVGGAFAQDMGVTATGLCTAYLKVAADHPRLGAFEGTATVTAVTGRWRLHASVAGKIISAEVSAPGTIALPARALEAFAGADAGLAVHVTFEPLDTVHGSITVSSVTILPISTGKPSGLPAPGTLPSRSGRFFHLSDTGASLATSASLLSSTDTITLDPDAGWALRVNGFVREVNGGPITFTIGTVAIAISTPVLTATTGPVVQVDVTQTVAAVQVYSATVICPASLLRRCHDIVVGHSTAEGLAVKVNGQAGTITAGPTGSLQATTGQVSLAHVRTGAVRICESVDATPRRRLWITSPQERDFALDRWTVFGRVSWYGSQPSQERVNYAFGDIALMYRAPIDCTVRAVYFGVGAAWEGALGSLGVGDYDDLTDTMMPIAPTGLGTDLDLTNVAQKNARRVISPYETQRSIIQAGQVIYFQPDQACEVIVCVRVDLEAA